MSVQARVAVPPTDFLLGRTMAIDTGARIELERVVPLHGGIVPYLRVESDDPALVTDMIAAESAVTGVEPIHRGDEWLLRVHWDGGDCEFLAVLAETDAACVEAVAVDGTWYLTVRFRTHEQLTDWYHRCTDLEVRLTVERVHEVETLRDDDANALTKRQYEALGAALDAGYFAVPRAATLEEVAARLDISDTAASQRIRRGTRNLLTSSLERRTSAPE